MKQGGGGGGAVVSTQLVQSAKKKPKALREKNRYGTVIVKVASLTSNRRVLERQNTFTITPRGGLFYGTQCSPALVQKVLQSADFSVLPPAEISLGDSRAHKLMVVYSNGWHAIPAPETFSRHSGTCIILGDRNNTGLPFPIKLGDCFRLGSVGLVVSELRTADGEEQRLDNRMLQYLKDEALEFDMADEMAALAADEEKASPTKTSGLSVRLPGADAKLGIANGEKFICYMCYETHDTAEDPLVAPCDCKGDTRYLHVQCLQKWYHSSICGPTARVIRTTGNGAPACKICGTAYKTAFRKPDGRTANLLEMETAGPYLSLVVVTRHDTNPGLFNTKFRLNFGRMANSPAEDPADIASQPNALIIGRSSSCSMVLDYRTVSTVHAILYYNEGKFFLQDRRSSNGTMVYLQEPLELPFSHPIRLRMGRSTLIIQAKRNWMTSMRGAFGTIRSHITHPTPEELMQVFSLSNVNPNNSANSSRMDSQALTSLGLMGTNSPHPNSPHPMPLGPIIMHPTTALGGGNFFSGNLTGTGVDSPPVRPGLASDALSIGEGSNSSAVEVLPDVVSFSSVASPQRSTEGSMVAQINDMNNLLSTSQSLSENGEVICQSPNTARIEEIEGKKDVSLNRGQTLHDDSGNNTPRSNWNVNSNIVLTNGAITDIEGSNTLMSNEMLNIVRASSPAHEYVRTNRSPPTFLSTTDLTAAGAFAFAEPAAGAFATPHNSGKYNRGSINLPSPLDAESLSGSARMLSNDDKEVVDKGSITRVPLGEDLVNHESPSGGVSGQLKSEVPVTPPHVEETRAPTGNFDRKGSASTSSAPNSPKENDSKGSFGSGSLPKKTCEQGLSSGSSADEPHRRGSRWSPLSTINHAVNSTMGAHAASAVNNANSSSVESAVPVGSISERTDSDQDAEAPTRERAATDATGDDNDPADGEATTFENIDEDN
eukprot:CAMPEP_0119040282 /NCGR_PEP_ID=MMETSP1177-20130426/10155_1 /TAXON_ID=2985 /ORGANISM="Ochromonas sp, Strain CCMP1899" /LENGTH=941 /DNA_ID=CAMNT_0007005183 /DNA_START=421 /DNA_END=3246 /DNA_ORIENTATION=+